MTHPKIRDFLYARDRATLRKDWGIVRATTADLRRWNVPDDATLANPRGNRPRSGRAPEEDLFVPRTATKPKPMRCEHGNVADRCVLCDPELEAK